MGNKVVKNEDPIYYKSYNMGNKVVKNKEGELYYNNGKLHRPAEIGPAKILSNGTQLYYEYGKPHRPHELGPAQIWPCGVQLYYENGIKHRPAELGPAEIWRNGDQEYWEHGKRHRPHELGPAIISRSFGYKYYYEHGVEKTLKEFQAIYKIQRWFRWRRFCNKRRELFEKVLGLPANHDSVLGMLYPNGGDLYKETYKGLQNFLETF